MAASILAALLVSGSVAWAQEATVADFVEPGVDIATYVDRYLHDTRFSAWYDEWYPTTEFHEALGLSQAEYQTIVNSLTGVAGCPAGTELVGDRCVVSAMEGQAPAAGSSVSAAEELEAQGEGLQLGVAAAAGFGVAIGVLLVLWLPSRVRRRIARSQARKAEE